jgi:hypothetical protein
VDLRQSPDSFEKEVLGRWVELGSQGCGKSDTLDTFWDLEIHSVHNWYPE